MTTKAVGWRALAPAMTGREARLRVEHSKAVDSISDTDTSEREAERTRARDERTAATRALFGEEEAPTARTRIVSGDPEDARTRVLPGEEPTHVPDGVVAAPPADVRPLVLGRYRLGRQIGAGGFGVVWHARDERLERDVAVKVLARSQRTGSRAEREAFAAARLNHPGIVSLFELAEDEDARYLVSELSAGAPSPSSSPTTRSRTATWRASASPCATRWSTRTPRASSTAT